MKAVPLVISIVAVLAMFMALWPSVASQTNPVKLTDTSAEPAFCRIDLGTTGSVNDDTFYLSLDGDDDAVEANDIRLTAFGTKGPGTLVQAGDSSELSISGTDCQTMTIAYYDGHPNSRYGPGDYVLVGYNKATTTLVEGSTHTGDYWVRLTAYGSLAAGTVMMSGQADLSAFQGGTAHTNAEHAFWDKDASAAFNAGDIAYIAAKAVATNDHLPVASIRLINATYFFGSSAAIGDSDVSLALTDPSTDAAICRIDFGTAGAMGDDGFYLSMDGDDEAVEAQDLRLVAYGGKPAGSVVVSSDTAEVATAVCQAYTPAYYDVTGNGAFGIGDVVLIGYDKTTTTLVQPSNSDGDWWIRLTASGTLAAGTIVNGGDADYVSKTAGSALTGGEFAYYDADGSTTFSVNDWAYLTAAAIADKERPPNASARLHGPVYEFGTLVKAGDRDGPYQAATTTTTTSTGTTTGTTGTTTTTTTSTTTGNTTSPAFTVDTGQPEGTRPTPGLGAIGLVVAVGALALALGRRRKA